MYILCVYIRAMFMWVYGCVLAYAHPRAGKGTEDWGDSQHAGTALIIDSVLSLWRYYSGFGQALLLWKTCLGGSGAACEHGTMWEWPWSHARCSWRRENLKHLLLGGETHTRVSFTFRSGSILLANVDFTFILWSLLILFPPAKGFWWGARINEKEIWKFSWH